MSTNLLLALYTAYHVGARAFAPGTCIVPTVHPADEVPVPATESSFGNNTESAGDLLARIANRAEPSMGLDSDPVRLATQAGSATTSDRLFFGRVRTHVLTAHDGATSSGWQLTPYGEQVRDELRALPGEDAKRARLVERCGTDYVAQIDDGVAYAAALRIVPQIETDRATLEAYVQNPRACLDKRFVSPEAKIRVAFGQIGGEPVRLDDLEPAVAAEIEAGRKACPGNFAPAQKTGDGTYVCGVEAAGSCVALYHELGRRAAAIAPQKPAQLAFTTQTYQRDDFVSAGLLDPGPSEPLAPRTIMLDQLGGVFVFKTFVTLEAAFEDARLVAQDAALIAAEQAALAADLARIRKAFADCGRDMATCRATLDALEHAFDYKLHATRIGQMTGLDASRTLDLAGYCRVMGPQAFRAKFARNYESWAATLQEIAAASGAPTAIAGKDVADWTFPANDPLTEGGETLRAIDDFCAELGDHAKTLATLDLTNPAGRYMPAQSGPLPYLPRLQSLKINGTYDYVFEHLAELGSVQELTILNAGNGKDGQQIALMPKLRSLTLEGYMNEWIANEHGMGLIRGFLRNPTTRVLELRHRPDTSWDDVDLGEFPVAYHHGWHDLEQVAIDDDVMKRAVGIEKFFGLAAGHTCQETASLDEVRKWTGYELKMRLDQHVRLQRSHCCVAVATRCNALKAERSDWSDVICNDARACRPLGASRT